MIRLAMISLALGACAHGVSDVPVEGACGASALQELVGRDMSALAAMTFPDTTRFISPGDAITMDFSPSRLNFDLDENGVITRIWCG